MSRTKAAEAAPSEPIRLAYVGNGRRFVIGVPTADVEIEDPAEANRLIETGLYVLAGSLPEKPADQLSPAKTEAAGE